MVSGQVKEVSVQYQVSRDSCDSVDSIESQVCPRGYKQTEVGLIPEDWSLVQLDKLANKIIDGTHHTPTYTKHGVPFLRVTDVQSNEIDFSKLKYVSIEEHEVLIKRCKPEKGDLLLSKNGTIGIPKVVTWDWTFSIFVSLALIKLKKEKLSPEFLEQFFKSDYLDLQIKQKSKQGTVTNLHLEEIKEFLIPLPPFIKEQTAIANALSDVDALITSLEKLIGKKRAIKTAAMQQLLTGKKRLPPFDLAHTGYKQTEQGGIPEDWEAGELGDYLESCSSGATPYRGTPKFYKGNIRWISSGELNYNVIYDTIEKISDEAVKKTNLKIHPKGTFLMAITGLEAAGTRGSCGIVGAPSATNQSCMALYPNKKLSTDFLFHYYVYKGDELALKYCQGTKQQSYTAKLVRVLPLIVPGTIEEQNAIATALSDMDKEIESIESRLNKTQQLKQGMMQELLTGRTRLL